MSKHYTEADYDPFIGKPGESNKGLLPLPNAEDIDPLAFLNNLASDGHMMQPKWGYAIIVDPHGGHQRQQWTQFFLRDGGEGYAVTYGGQRWEKNAEGKQVGIDTPIVRRFAICKHEKEEGAGANHRRGWHPGKCRLCGMDMSYDSGD
jgi:hypothetical protein